jgi:hypothetical protein
MVKIYSSTHHNSRTTGVLTIEQVTHEYTYNDQHKKPNDIGWCWKHAHNRVGIFNYEEILDQLAEWRKMPEVFCLQDNNQEVTTPDGKTWWSLTVSHDDASLDSCALLLFGNMVSGYVYYFETKEIRDLLFTAIKTKTAPPAQSKTTPTERGEWFQRSCNWNGPLPDDAQRPKCCFCSATCEDQYGNNPNPFYAGSGLRCCNSCNTTQVIPARLDGQIATDDLKDPHNKEVFLKRCYKLVDASFKDVYTLFDKNDERAYFQQLNLLNLKSPALDKAIDAYGRHLIKCKEAVDGNKEAVYKYVRERADRHIKCRSITSPKEVFATAAIIVPPQPLAELATMLTTIKQVVLEEQAKIAAELAAEISSVSSSDSSVQSKEEKKKEQTRKANNKRDAKKREQEAFNEQVKAAARAIQEQERLKKEKKFRAQQKKIKEAKAAAEAEEYADMPDLREPSAIVLALLKVKNA